MHYLRGCAILFHKLIWKLIVVFFCFRKSGQNKIYNILNERCSDPREKHTNLNRSPPKKNNISIKVMQIYLPIRPQTGFHGDEMATSNWLDEKEACIWAKNMRRLGKFTDPFVLEYTQTRGTSWGWGGSEGAARGTGGKMRGEARSALTQIRARALRCGRARARIHWPLGPFQSAWIKVRSRCRVNMKAFTAVSKGAGFD